jgi:hypothetical protein
MGSKENMVPPPTTIRTRQRSFSVTTAGQDLAMHRIRIITRRNISRQLLKVEIRASPSLQIDGATHCSTTSKVTVSIVAERKNRKEGPPPLQKE